MTNNSDIKLTRAECNPLQNYEYEAHELAAMMPMIKGDEFENLKIDIRKRGILFPIKLYGGRPDETQGALRILDGRNRYTAGKAVGLKFTAAHFEEFKGTYAEAEAFVISANFTRRQLTNAQKQELIIKMIQKCPNASNRAIARMLSLPGHSTVAAARDRLKNPPEKKEFEAFKKTWDRLPDDTRSAFVEEFQSDIREMLKG